jgi:phospholipid/cholesterol/gamma-HCH transport system substrate-binding protein
VEFTANNAVVLTDGSQAAIRYDNLIGGRYLELLEGAGGTRKLNAGDTIAMDRTAPAPRPRCVVCGGFPPLFRAHRPDQVNKLSGELISAVPRDKRLTSVRFLTQTAALTSTLADRDELIGQVVGQSEHRARVTRRPRRSVRQSRGFVVTR